ncbi:MAG: DUF4139 domain-containing protein [Planctomycetes bacterium]|nr:DUF4139 domain-containing protein [Planctomycetota bacterium]
MKLKKLLATAIVAIALTSAMAAAQTTEEKDKTAPPVRKIVLYKHGMGYFERVGKIRDDAVVTLDFKTDQMQDLLTSLYAIDYGKDCKITSIGYDSKDPIDKQLENILIRVPEGSALTQFVTQLKGVRVEIKVGTETARGSILGIEPVSQKVDDAVLTAFKVVLLKEDGAIQPFNLFDVSSMKILDARIQEDLQRILDIYKNSKYTDRKQVRIQTVGKGERNIQIGYLIEMPIWKTSYRLILAEEPAAKPYLQGWAIMENPTDEDWKDVNISFVAGNPISFKLDLYTSYYPQRPVINLASIIPLVGGLIAMDKFAQSDMGLDLSLAEESMEKDNNYDAKGYGGGARKSKRVAAGYMDAPASPGAPAPSMSQMLARSVSSIASGVQIGELFAYESKSPISVGRRQAAMVPIVTEFMDGSKILYYRAAVSPKLMNAFYLTNSSKLTLETGPVNLFEGSTAVGEGLLKQSLQPGMKEIIPFAIEAGCSIETIGKDEYKPIHKASFVNGVMVLRQFLLKETAYKCINKSPKGFTFYLDHPKSGGYTLIDTAKPEEEVAGYYRFKMDLAVGKTLEFKVSEQQEVASQVYVQNQSLDQIRFYLEQGYLSGKAKGLLKDVVGYMNSIAEYERVIQEARKESEKLVNDQERYRKNMQILNTNNPKESEKRAEYLERLTKIEERLEKLDNTIRETSEKQRIIRAELNQKVQGFTEE